MVMRDVKEEEVVNRITKMAAKLHFSGDWSSISGMKGNKLVMENMDYNKEKLTTKFAKMDRSKVIHISLLAEMKMSDQIKN